MQSAGLREKEGEVRDAGNRITAHVPDESGIDIVQLGHGLGPVAVVREGKVNCRHGIPGLTDCKIACATLYRGGVRLEVLSISEMQKRVLSLHSPNIQERWYADVQLCRSFRF